MRRIQLILTLALAIIGSGLIYAGTGVDAGVQNLALQPDTTITTSQIQGSARVPPVCDATLRLTCVPLADYSATVYPGTSIRNCMQEATSTDATYTFSYRCDGGVERPVESSDVRSCPSSAYATRNHGSSSGITPIRYCEAKPIDATLDCERLANNIYQILEPPSDTVANTCLKDEGLLAPICPSGYIKFTSDVGHGSANLNQFVFGAPLPSIVPEFCMKYIERPTKCPAPTMGTNNVVFAALAGICIEQEILDSTATACGSDFLGTAPNNCAKIVANVPAACPGSALTQSQIDANSLPSRFSVGDLLPDSSATSALVIYRQAGYPLLMSRQGLWLNIAAVDDVPMAGGAPVPAVCAQITDIVAPSCVSGTTTIVGITGTDKSCARLTTRGECSTIFQRIDVSSTLTITEPIAGKLQISMSSATLPTGFAGSTRCFLNVRTHLTCTASSPNFALTNIRQCLPDGISLDTFSCSGFLNRETGMCDTSESLSVSPTPACSTPAYPTQLTDDLCGKEIANWKLNVQCENPTQLVVKLNPSDTDAQPDCYFPSRYVCQGLEISRGYFLLRQMVEYSAVTQAPSAPAITVAKTTFVYCVFGLNLSCPENFELARVGSPARVSISNPQCRPTDTSSSDPNQVATVVSCPSGQLSIGVRTPALTETSRDDIYEAVSLQYSNPLPSESAVKANLAFCGQAARAESFPVCESGKTLIDTDGQSLSSSSQKNGFYDLCYDAALPTCGASSGCGGARKYTYTSGSCASGRTLVMADRSYNALDGDICVLTASRGLPTRCAGSTGFVYLSKEQISGTSFLTDSMTSNPLRAQFAAIKQASTDGICGRNVEPAINCAPVTGKTVGFYAFTRGRYSFASGCYETAAAAAGCPAEYTLSSDGTKCLSDTPTGTTTAVARGSCDAGATGGIHIPSFRVIPQPGSLAALINRYFVAQPLEVRFSFPRSVLCDGGRQTLEIVSVTVLFEEIQPFVLDFSQAIPTGDWTMNPELEKSPGVLKTGINLGNWGCVNVPTSTSSGKCVNQAGNLQRNNFRALYRNLYNSTSGPWGEPIEESIVCVNANVAPCELVNTGESVVRFAPPRATWYRASILFIWSLTEGVDTVAAVSDSVDTIISVGELQSSIFLGG